MCCLYWPKLDPQQCHDRKMVVCGCPTYVNVLFALFRSCCVICDMMTAVRDHHFVSPCDLPHMKIFSARQTMLKSMNELCRVFANNPHDPDDLLVGLVLSVHGFDEENNCGKLHVCKGCHKPLSNKNNPQAALGERFSGR